MVATPIGIAIMAFQRPHYLKVTLETLAANDLTGCDVHLWQDGDVDALTGERVALAEEIAQSVATWEAAQLPNKTLHRNAKNLCCAAQRFQIMPYMAERYERFICLDGDMQLGRYAITHMKTLFDQFADDPLAGSISPGCRLLGEPPEQFRNKVAYAPGHFWCEGYWTEKWKRLWPWYEQYYAKVRTTPYRKITDCNDLIKSWNRVLGLGPYTDGPSSDVALARALILCHFERLRLVVNRATGIGETGLHARPEMMREMGVVFQPIHEWADEESIKSFELADVRKHKA